MMNHCAGICGCRKSAAANQYKHFPQKWIFTRQLFGQSGMKLCSDEIAATGIQDESFPQLVCAVCGPIQVFFERRVNSLDVDMIEISERLVAQVRYEHRAIHIFTAAIA